MRNVSSNLKDSLLKRDKKIGFIRFLLLLFIILMIVSNFYLSSIRLSSSTEFYQVVGDNELKALNWIKGNTSPNDVFATLGLVGRWVEGYSGRKSLMSCDPQVFIFKDEREENDVANMVFSATHTSENNYIRLYEAFPFHDLGNPGIAVKKDGMFWNSIIFDDTFTTVSYTSGNDSKAVRYASFSQAQNKSMLLSCNDSVWEAYYSYYWGDMTATRAVIMESDSPFVELTYRIDLENSSLKYFYANVWGSRQSVFENYKVDENETTFSQKILNERLRVKISILETSGLTAVTNLFLNDPVRLAPRIFYAFNHTATLNRSYLCVKFRVELIEHDQNSEGFLHYYNTYELIKEYSIDYILLSKDWAEIKQRFLDDSDHFKKVYENESIIIFKTN